MMGYSTDESVVRVDFFDPERRGGMKWKYTEAVRWTGEYDSPSLVDFEFAVSLEEHLQRPLGGHRMRGLVAVCLRPYHETSFPLAVNVDDAVAAVIRRRSR